MVSRSKRLKWGYTGRLRYLLQLIGVRAYRDNWSKILLSRYRRIEKVYKSRPDKDDDSTYPQHYR